MLKIEQRSRKNALISFETIMILRKNKEFNY